MPEPALNDEEVAYKIVSLYFEEIARLGIKRSLDLDAIINAYFYTLRRLKSRNKDMQAIQKLVKAEEKKLAGENLGQLFPKIE